MNTYQPGEYYDFTSVGIYEDANGIRYIALNDGTGEPQKVKPYDFQTEWTDIIGAKIRCFCYKIGINGNPLFQQDHYGILSDCYNGEGEECAFTVMDRRIDTRNNQQFYQIQDVYGIGHRYYSNENYEKFQEITLKVVGINKKDNNRAYLVLKPLESEISTLTPKYEILKESKFGQEKST